jgi:polyisoprenyl-phosphate glycosyltransferase
MKASLVIPLYNEEKVFPSLRAALVKFADALGRGLEVEIILVNDGSRDGTWAQILEFARGDRRVKGVSLSRNFGHQIALYCGYKFASGDAIVSLDGDLQDPPEVILQMLEKWRAGADVVFAVRRQRHGESAFKLATAHYFYKLMGYLADTRAPLDCGDFRLLSRRALAALLQMGDNQIYLRGMVGWIGYETATVEYDRPARAAGETKFNLMKMVRFALDGIFSFSQFPLRLCLWLCLLAMTPFLLYLAHAFYQKFTGSHELVPGWTSLLLCIIAFGCINIVAIAILGEYVGRIYDVVKQRPLYFVKDLTSPELASFLAPGPAGARPERPPGSGS